MLDSSYTRGLLGLQARHSEASHCMDAGALGRERDAPLRGVCVHTGLAKAADSLHHRGCLLTDTVQGMGTCDVLPTTMRRRAQQRARLVHHGGQSRIDAVVAAALLRPPNFQLAHGTERRSLLDGRASWRQASSCAPNW